MRRQYRDEGYHPRSEVLGETWRRAGKEEDSSCNSWGCLQEEGLRENIAVLISVLKSQTCLLILQNGAAFHLFYNFIWFLGCIVLPEVVLQLLQPKGENQFFTRL